MHSRILIFFAAMLLSGCDMFTTQPIPYPVWSPAPSPTPGIQSPTPLIIAPTSNVTILPVITLTSTATPSTTASATPQTPSATSTNAIVQSLAVDILGCNTGFDITHGMGEVTNAFVIVKNTGNVDLPNTCALLRASDEDRVHPDKQKCVANLPAQSQVTLKLTVDSAFRQSTIIQVDASSNDQLLLRVDKQSCSDISLFGGEPSDVGVIKPISP